jgi:hypothetical protein
MNATPMHRPETVLLLQPWSTEITQAMKNKMAIPPNTLSHIVFSPPYIAEAVMIVKGSESQGRVSIEKWFRHRVIPERCPPVQFRVRKTRQVEGVSYRLAEGSLLLALGDLNRRLQ